MRALRTSALLVMVVAACGSGRGAVAPAAPGGGENAEPIEQADQPEEAVPRVAFALSAQVALDVSEPDSHVLHSAPVRAIGVCDPAEREKGIARITMAHLNDMQARYSDRLAGKSRYAYVAGWIEQLRRDVPNTIVLDAGDDYEKGSVAELRSMGESTRQMVQALPIDVRTIGNHDFAYGEEAVLRDARTSRHPLLAANVRHAGRVEAEQPFKAFARVDVGCVRVGVIGLVTRNYGADDQPTKEPFDGVFVQDARYSEVLAREVEAHRGEVDVLVALTHLGLFEDAVLSHATDDLDLVVGAHTEDLLFSPRPAYRPDGSRTWVVQAGHFAQTLGRADLVVNLKTKSVVVEQYKIVNVDASLPADDEVAALADRLEAGAHEPIATAKRAIALGRDMADLTYRAAASEWGVDAMFLGRDAFWQGIKSGPVTLQSLYDSVLVQREPAGTSGFTSLWLADVSGAELARIRSRLGTASYDVFLPSKIDPARIYRIATDKRALTYPRAVFGYTPDWHAPRMGGEIIDVLEAYARRRQSSGESLD